METTLRHGELALIVATLRTRAFKETGQAEHEMARTLSDIADKLSPFVIEPRLVGVVVTENDTVTA